MAETLSSDTIWRALEAAGLLPAGPPTELVLRVAYPKEALIMDMDGKMGAPLELTILTEEGRGWTTVAGSGASVDHADTVADYGRGHVIGNYGEYSGAPSIEETS
eukprot:59710-Alexandrium_andersonii.AAC.1